MVSVPYSKGYFYRDTYLCIAYQHEKNLEKERIRIIFNLYAYSITRYFHVQVFFFIFFCIRVLCVFLDVLQELKKT